MGKKRVPSSVRKDQPNMSRKQITSKIITQPPNTTANSPLAPLDINLCVGSPPFGAASAARKPQFFCLRARLHSAEAAALSRAPVRLPPLPANDINLQQPHQTGIIFFLSFGGGSVCVWGGAGAPGGSHAAQSTVRSCDSFFGGACGYTFRLQKT